MNPWKSVTLIVIAFLLTDCERNKNTGKNDQNDASKIDSCGIALKFENTVWSEAMVEKNYSGELNNYWSNDNSKLDFKHVFLKGKLIKSYFYYENQNIQEEYSFKCGALHGLQKWYYENGKLAKSIHFSYGYRNGKGLLFDQHGSLKREIIFRNDSIVKETEY